MGGYGTTRYHHTLECGHTEVRRRPASAPTLGCLRCAETARLEQMLVDLADTPDTPDLVSVDASIEVEIARLRAGLAGMLLIDLDDVSMQVSVDGSTTRLQGAYVWVSADSLKALRPKLLGS